MKYLVFYGLLICFPFISAQHSRGIQVLCCIFDFIKAQLVSACEGLSWGSLKDCIERERNTVVSYGCGGKTGHGAYCSENGFIGCLSYVDGPTHVDCCIDRNGKAEVCVAPDGAEEVDSASATVKL